MQICLCSLNSITVSHVFSCSAALRLHRKSIRLRRLQQRKLGLRSRVHCSIMTVRLTSGSLPTLRLSSLGSPRLAWELRRSLDRVLQWLQMGNLGRRIVVSESVSCPWQLPNDSTVTATALRLGVLEPHVGLDRTLVAHLHLLSHQQRQMPRRWRPRPRRRRRSRRLALSTLQQWHGNGSRCVPVPLRTPRFAPRRTGRRMPRRTTRRTPRRTTGRTPRRTTRRTPRRTTRRTPRRTTRSARNGTTRRTRSQSRRSVPSRTRSNLRRQVRIQRSPPAHLCLPHRPQAQMMVMAVQMMILIMTLTGATV